MRAVIVAGSALSRALDLKDLSTGDLIVAVDAGADAFAGMALAPDLFVGDMDSVTTETRAMMQAKGVETIVLRTDKDETDLEHALRLVVDRGAKEVIVFAALGGPRLDHLIGNILLLTSPWLKGVDVRLVDGQHEVLVAGGDAEVRGRPGDVVSLLPLMAEVDDVRTEGLLYPLEGESLMASSTRAISNEMTATLARVTHGAGDLLVVHYLGRAT